jgi:hypothetical protein
MLGLKIKCPDSIFDKPVISLKDTEYYVGEYGESVIRNICR